MIFTRELLRRTRARRAGGTRAGRRLSLARAPGGEAQFWAAQETAAAPAAPAPGGRPGRRTRRSTSAGKSATGKPGRQPKASSSAGVEAGAGAERQRLAGEEPAERPLAAAPLEAAGGAGRGRCGRGRRRRPARAPSSTCANQPSRKISPPESPASVFAAMRGADDAVDVLLPQPRRGPADLNDPLQHVPAAFCPCRPRGLPRDRPRGCRASHRILIAPKHPPAPAAASRRAAAAGKLSRNAVAD